jgi:hypothetical protein
MGDRSTLRDAASKSPPRNVTISAMAAAAAQITMCTPNPQSTASALAMIASTIAANQTPARINTNSMDPSLP